MKFRNVAIAAAAALIAGVIAAAAGNTTFFTSIGDLVFPFTAPTTNPSAPGTIDNMTIGATTPAAIHGTTLSATGAVTGAGFTSQFASPPAIGTTTPAAGNFTTLGATSVGSGLFTTLGASDQISSTAGLPTIGSGNCGTGSNGAVVAGSTNQSGSITIGATATTSCAVAFSKTLGVTPNAVLLYPANAAAAATGTTVARVSAISATGFTITGSALANANYYYFVF